MTNKHYKRLTIGLICAWFLVSLLASARNVYKSTSDLPAISLAIAAAAPIVVYALWYATSTGFRRFLFSLNPRSLTAAQTWRINGIIFLVLTAFGMLPAIFALPAGIGDMAIGATAPFIARNFSRDGSFKGFVRWQLLGMLDLVTAVTLGITARLIVRSGPGMDPMTVLPLSLIPTFFVPLLFIFHLICLAHIRQNRASRNTNAGTAAANHRIASNTSKLSASR